METYTRVNEIFNDVLEAMQQAEERSGVEGVEYITLMQNIADEALSRIVACASTYIQKGE